MRRPKSNATTREQNHHLTIQSGLGGDHSGTMTQEEYDRFRAVHDVFGHAGIGSGSDRHGEYRGVAGSRCDVPRQGRRAMSTEYHGANPRPCGRGSGFAEDRQVCAAARRVR